MDALLRLFAIHLPEVLCLVAEVCLLDYVYFGILPRLAYRRYRRTDPEVLRRYLERVVATPSLLGSIRKLFSRASLAGIYLNRRQHAEAAAHTAKIDSVLVSDGTRLVLAMAEAVLMVCQAGPGGKAAAFREAKEHLKSAAGSCASKDVPAGAARAYRRVVSCVAGEAGTLGAKLWALWQRVSPWVK